MDWLTVAGDARSFTLLTNELDVLELAGAHVSAEALLAVTAEGGQAGDDVVAWLHVVDSRADLTAETRKT